MQDKTDCVIQDTGSREGTVTAVMGDDPEACPYYTLTEAIHVDSDIVSHVRMSHDLSVGQIIQPTETESRVDEISNEEEDGPVQGRAKAIARNGVSKVL